VFHAAGGLWGRIIGIYHGLATPFYVFLQNIF